MHKVQLFRIAVDFSFDFFPKTKLTSFSAVSGASLPWQAFWVPSIPYNALNEFGAFYLAVKEFVGPIRSLHLLIASEATSYIPTT